MFLHQMGYAACAIPGAGNYQDHWNMYFEEARRVFLVLDNDDAGRKGVFTIQQQLGRKARHIELPIPEVSDVDSTDISEFFLRDGHTKGDFEELVTKARGQRVFKLGPGLLPGQVCTILAKTGAGKTAFLTQLIHNLSSWQPYDKSTTGPGLPVLLLSLEQTKAEIAERLERISRLYSPSVPRAEIEWWHSALRVTDENKIPAADVPVLIEEFVEEVGKQPRLVVVDYLGYWARGFPSKSKYEQVSEAVMELKRLAKEREIAIVAPHQVSRSGRRGERLELDFARDSGVVEETSDFVFSLFKPSEKVEQDPDVELDYRQKSEVRLEILKSRHGGVGKTILMDWAPYSLALVPRGDRAKEMQTEWRALDAQLPYGEVLKAHRGMRFV
jgi:hypothetical protein